PSTPAQYCHLLRRQALRDLRKPLVVLTPKSLLRLHAARSGTEDFVQGPFREVIGDPDHPHPSVVSRVILCQGKMYYDLLKRRQDEDVRGVALDRVVQL